MMSKVLRSVKILYKNDSFVVLDDGSLLYNYKIGPNGLITGVFVGQIVQEVDGYYHWVAGSMTGLWTANALNEIANVLNEMNRNWDDQVRRDLSND